MSLILGKSSQPKVFEAINVLQTARNDIQRMPRFKGQTMVIKGLNRLIERLNRHG